MCALHLVKTIHLITIQTKLSIKMEIQIDDRDAHTSNFRLAALPVLRSLFELESINCLKNFLSSYTLYWFRQCYIILDSLPSSIQCNSSLERQITCAAIRIEFSSKSPTHSQSQIMGLCSDSSSACKVLHSRIHVRKYLQCRQNI